MRPALRRFGAQVASASCVTKALVWWKLLLGKGRFKDGGKRVGKQPMKRAVSVSRPHLRWQASLACAICCGDKSTSTQDLVACLRAPYFRFSFYLASATTAFKTFSATAIIAGLTKSFSGNRLLSNVGFTCKDVWRGPGASQVRDKRLCQVEAPVRKPPRTLNDPPPHPTQ